MSRHLSPASARALPTSPPVFLAITPEIRSALELLAEAAVDLLDEIDRPLADCEVDADFEETRDDDEDGGDDEPSLGSIDGRAIGADDDREPDLGSTIDGDASGTALDEDLVAVETSGGFPPTAIRDHRHRAAARATFDPRLARRPAGGDDPDQCRRSLMAPRSPARFAHDPVNRPATATAMELARLARELARIEAPTRPRRARK